MRFTRIMPVLSVLLLPALLASPASAQALTSSPGPRPATATPMQHFGVNCVTVKSRGGLNAEICAIVNRDDIRDPLTYMQALITFSVKSGSIKKISATDLYLKACTTHFVCTEENNVRFPIRRSGKGVRKSFLNNAFFNASSDIETVQAFVKTPCIEWSNDQSACYREVLKSAVVDIT